MVPNHRTTTNATTVPRSTFAAPAEPKKDEAREACHIFKCVIISLVSLIAFVITCVYISHAYSHYEIISANPEILKAPYGLFDLSYEKIGYIFAIGRVILLVVILAAVPSVPECFLFLLTVLLLLFEIPMACVAESNLGYLVNFAQLDLSPPTVGCTNTTMTPLQWSFYTDYSVIAGRPAEAICQEFAHEGSVLRASLLFSWFAMWIPVFACAFLFSLCNTERKWSTFLTYFSGIEFSFSWAAVKNFFRPKLSCGRRTSSGGDDSSSASTIAEEMEIRIGEKV